MSNKQIIGMLKNLKTVSKVDDNGRAIHTITTTIELIDNGGREHIHEIAKSLNKPIRVDFEAVQLEIPM